MEINKIFSALGGISQGRFPLRSNVMGSGYQPIGGFNQYGADYDNKNKSVVGNAVSDKNLSTYYSKLTEIKGYEMSDISEMITSLFKDYVVNFMNKTGDIVTIKNEDGSINEQKSIRLNRCLVNDLKIPDVIRTHLPEIIYYGGYHFLLTKTRDESGHILLNKRDLYDPVVVVTKTKDYSEITYVCRGDDGKIYEVPYEEMIKISINSLRLINDLDKDPYSFGHVALKPENKTESNRDKISSDTFYTAPMPAYYSITHKVKEYLLKDVIVSLLSIKDLVQPLLLMVHLDKGTSLEAANDLTKKAEALINNYTDLSAIMSAQFGISDIIESLLNNVRVLPDYNSSLTNMGTVELNKINQKIQEMRMELDNCKDGVLSSMGVPLDLAQGRVSKWEVLKMSERLNSRINSIISGIKSSIKDAVNVISLNLYNEEVDPNMVEVHLFSRTTIEYNNMTNNAESISNLTQQMITVLDSSLRLLESSAGLLVDKEHYLGYVSTLLKNIDPEFDQIITQESISEYIDVLNQKLQQGVTGDEY